MDWRDVGYEAFVNSKAGKHQCCGSSLEYTGGQGSQSASSGKGRERVNGHRQEYSEVSDGSEQGARSLQVDTKVVRRQIQETGVQLAAESSKAETSGRVSGRPVSLRAELQSERARDAEWELQMLSATWQPPEWYSASPAEQADVINCSSCTGSGWLLEEHKADSRRTRKSQHYPGVSLVQWVDWEVTATPATSKNFIQVAQQPGEGNSKMDTSGKWLAKPLPALKNFSKAMESPVHILDMLLGPFTGSQAGAVESGTSLDSWESVAAWPTTPDGKEELSPQSPIKARYDGSSSQEYHFGSWPSLAHASCQGSGSTADVGNPEGETARPWSYCEAAQRGSLKARKHMYHAENSKSSFCSWPSPQASEYYKSTGPLRPWPVDELEDSLAPRLRLRPISARREAAFRRAAFGSPKKNTECSTEETAAPSSPLPLLELPPEILSHVLEMASGVSANQAVRLMLVCKRFKQALQLTLKNRQSLTWKPAFAFSDPRRAYLWQLLTEHKLTGVNSLTCSPGFIQTFPDRHLDLLSRMKRLEFSLEQMIWEGGIGQGLPGELLRVTGGLPVLEELSLRLRIPAKHSSSAYQRYVDVSPLAACTQLRSLELRSNSTDILTVEGLSSLAALSHIQVAARGVKFGSAIVSQHFSSLRIDCYNLHNSPFILDSVARADKICIWWKHGQSTRPLAGDFDAFMLEESERLQDEILSLRPDLCAAFRPAMPFKRHKKQEGIKRNKRKRAVSQWGSRVLFSASCAVQIGRLGTGPPEPAFQYFQ